MPAEGNPGAPVRRITPVTFIAAYVHMRPVGRTVGLLEKAGLEVQLTASFWLSLLVTAAAVTALLLLGFLVALRVGRYNVVDTFWGLGFALMAGVAFAMSAGSGATPRRIALLAATVIWGLRLAWYIGWRSRGAAEDPRYAQLLKKLQAAGPRTRCARCSCCRPH